MHLVKQHVVHNYKKSKTTQFILTHIWQELEQDMNDILDICSTSVLYFKYFEHLVTAAFIKMWFKQNMCFNILWVHSFQCYMCCSCGVEQFFTTFLCLTDFRLGPLKQHSSKLGSLEVFLFVEVWMHTCSPPVFSLCHGRWPVFLVFALLLLIWLWIMTVCVLVSRCLFCGPSVLCRPCLCIASSVVRSLCEARVSESVFCVLSFLFCCDVPSCLVTPSCALPLCI